MSFFNKINKFTHQITPKVKSQISPKQQQNNLFSASVKSNTEMTLDELGDFLANSLLMTITINNQLTNVVRSQCLLTEVSHPSGINLHKSQFDLLWISCCDIPNSNFDNTKLRDSIFKWVTLSNSTFNNAELHNIFFEEVMFDNVNMSKARFSNVKITLDFPAKLGTLTKDQHQQKCDTYAKGVRWSIATISEISLRQNLQQQLDDWLQSN